MGKPFKITKLRCACCEGTGVCSMLGFTCMWCEGERRMSAADSRRYAQHIYMLAGGGYIAGDIDLKDMREMEAQAEAIYSVLGESAPWHQPGPAAPPSTASAPLSGEG